MMIKSIYFFLTAILAAFVSASAQIPQDIPHQSDPVDFSSGKNVAIYIGIPLLMIVLYIVIRNRRRKINNKQ